MESVIAILLVGIIMTAVLSTVLYTNSITKKAETKLYAINEIDNIITCFQVKDYTYYDMTVEEFEGLEELKFNKEFELFNSENYYYKIIVSFGTKEINLLEYSTISANAYSKDGKIIYSMANPYVRGVL